MTEIYVELGGKKAIAWSLEWPGWCRIRTSEAAAVQALIETEARYRLIAQQAERAVEHLRSYHGKPRASIERPVTLTVRMRNPDLAEMATWLERVEPDEDDPTVVRLRDDDLIRLYRTFITLVMLTRGIAE